MQRTLSRQRHATGVISGGSGDARWKDGRRSSRFWVAICLALCCALLAGLVSSRTVNAQARGQSTHIVQQGETLGQIAQRYGIGWQELAQWNGITDAGHIYPGQSLVLYGGNSGGQSWSSGGSGSGGSSTWGNSGSSNSAPIASSGSGGTHVVQAGETLPGIAQRYGVTAPQLVRANNLSTPPTLYPGQTLVLPGGSSTGGSASWGNSSGATQAAQPSAQQNQRQWQTPEPTARQTQSAYGGGHTPAAPTQVGKVILISIAQQHLWAFENGRLVLQTPVTTGRPGADTPVGTYNVLAKYSPYRFISPYPPGHEFYYDPVDSNYSLRITWNGHHIHDAPWRSDYGSGTNLPHTNSRGQWATGSIGCVNVPTSAMAQLYQWADDGIQVVIQ